MARFLDTGRKNPLRRPVAERVEDHRHVYRPLPESELRLQASRCMDCGVPFCHTGCPLENLIPDWNDLVRHGRWRQAIDRLHLTNNFPEFTGILCPAPCEAACVLTINDAAVTIKEVELAIVNRAFDEGWMVARPPARRSGRRVAVVGSGPAGLAAAQQLNRTGHRVTVFERDARPGGLLRYGIPDFKLEKWVLDRRLDLLEREGIEFVTGAHAGRNPTAEDLRRDFDALLLTVGALQERSLPLPGAGLGGIHPAMAYLTQRNRQLAGDPADPPATAISARGERVVIIGGGDTGADCLGCVHREGARDVQILTHGPRPPDSAGPLEWPDWPFILRSYPAHEEGGERSWQVTITGFSGDGGQVERVHLAEAARENGHAVPIPGTERELVADLVLLAIGFQGPVQDRLLEDLGLACNGPIAAQDYQTSVPGVYVAGDARLGASLIVTAIAEGRKAAQSIACALRQSLR